MFDAQLFVLDHATHKQKKKMVRKVFLDVGAHAGESLTEALDARHAFDVVFAIEPSKRCILPEDSPRVNVQRLALSNHTCVSTLFGSGTAAASVYSDNHDVATSVSETVEVVSAADWFRSNLEVGDEVYMRLDCGGSEVDVLEDLMRTGLLAMCAFVFVDFTVSSVPSQAHREHEIREQLADFAFRHRVSVHTNTELAHVAQADRVRIWLDRCNPVLCWVLPSLHKEFRMLSAHYGTERCTQDVTAALVANLGRKRGRVQVTNTLCGADPCVGYGKRLVIRCEVGGVPRTVTSVESGYLFVTDDPDTAVSIMMRCRNEAATCVRALLTLEHLLSFRVQYEVIVVLHLCNDESEALVRSYACTAPVKVRVLRYDLPVSRAGLETYVTDDSHQCSLITYYNWCLAQTRAPFVWKWDADFELNASVAREVSWLVSADDGQPLVIAIPTVFKDGSAGASEPWLSSAITAYEKHVFWEVARYMPGARNVTIKSNFLHNDSPNLVAKQYWSQRAWFNGAVEGMAYVFRKRLEAVHTFLGRPVAQDIARNCSVTANFEFEQLRGVDLAEIDRMWCEVTLVVTACNRPHLLKQTMQSFLDMNSAPVRECIIVEDSGLQGINDFVAEMCPFPVTLLYNPVNLGQLRSIDRAYDLVKTEFLMHMEEDMAFVRPGFIERSVPLLFLDPKVFCVWLRAGDAGVIHPFEPTDRGGYRKVVPGWQLGTETWCGFTFNSSLRLTRTARMHGPYSAMAWGKHDCNTRFAESGHFALVLNDQYVKHIGWGEHCPQTWA